MGKSLQRNAGKWAEAIRRALGSVVEDFITAGQHLTEAKADLGYTGYEWERWLGESVGISRQQASHLMSIAQYQPLLDRQHVVDLPGSWGTLYELTKLPDEAFRRAITDGLIYPGMERKEAVELIRDVKAAPARNAAAAVANKFGPAAPKGSTANPVVIEGELAGVDEPGEGGESGPTGLVLPEVELGQWWGLGDHLLFCGDSTDEAFVARAQEAGASFAFADPPYNTGKAEWDHGFVWRHDWLAKAAPIVAVTPGHSATAEFFRLTSMPYRWALAAWISNGMTRGAVGFGNWIFIALFAEGSIYRDAQDVKRLSDLTEVTIGRAEPTEHPSRKPAMLMTWLVDLFTKEGETVIDPFLGSGTTLFACNELGRRCVAAELDAGYCREVIGRYRGAGGKARLL